MVICAFSGSKYPTSNLYFPNIVRVRLVLKEEMENGDRFMKSMATRMLAKFEKYWAEFSTITAISTIVEFNTIMATRMLVYLSGHKKF